MGGPYNVWNIFYSKQCVGGAGMSTTDELVEMIHH